MKDKAKLELICALNLAPEPIQWLWKGWLALGKFHILAGVPGTGKTTIALSLAATITLGGQWPGGSQCEPGKVLIWSGEDDPKDTLLPRLLAQGANRNHIYFVSDVFEDNKPRAFDPSRDISRLYEKALEIGDIRLIIIDPVVNVVSGDSHKNGEVRRDLQPLVELGKKLNAAILGISHFNKGALGRDPLDRVTGSVAFAALARVVLVTAKIRDENGHLKSIFVRAKSNNGPDGGGYYYEIEEVELNDYRGLFSSKVIWGEGVEGSPHDLMINLNDSVALVERSALREAMDFLRVLLSQGPLPKKEVDDRAKEAGINGVTLRRAKTFLKVETIHESYGKGSVWKWSLPSKVIKTAKGDHENNIDSLDYL